MTLLAPYHRLPRNSCPERERQLLDLCAKRSVLHLACAAWPATKQWCEEGSLLHLRLAAAAKELAGFDLSGEGLGILERYGANNLQRVDLLDSDRVKEAWSRLPFEPEVVLVGEILEHLDTPGVLLRNLRSQMPDGCRLVVTVPSAFSLRGLFHAARGYEKVASDHVAYYSPANLAELLERSGFEVQKLLWYKRSGPRRGVERAMGWLVDSILWIQPQWSAGVLALCRAAQTDI